MMIRRIKRWWYRLTGQKAEAEYMLNLCQMLDDYTLAFLNDSGWAMRRWEHD